MIARRTRKDKENWLSRLQKRYACFVKNLIWDCLDCHILYDSGTDNERKPGFYPLLNRYNEEENRKKKRNIFKS